MTRSLSRVEALPIHHQSQDRQAPGLTIPPSLLARADQGIESHFPYLLPWLRVALIRSILATPFDETTWPTAKTTLARALTMRSRLSREGWWN